MAKSMTAVAVARLSTPGRHTVGGATGLALVISDKGQRSWTLRIVVGGKRREMGLGSASDVSLAQAREAAHEMRRVRLAGDDPIEERRDKRAAVAAAVTRQVPTLEEASRDYHARVIEPSRTEKHGAQWLTSLENHMPADLWRKPVDKITAPELLTALTAIRPHEAARNIADGRVMGETIRRVRQRLDAVFEDAIFHGLAATNPAAAVKRKLREMMPNGKAAAGKFAALPYAQAPALMERLREAQGAGAVCLRFAVLTAARTEEALLAEWSEIDLDARVWVLPASRMKCREVHTVYLSDAALELLVRQQGLHDRWVFPSAMKGYTDSPMSNMAMLNVLGRLGVREQTTAHGLCRATFSTWANETNAARPDVIEACLAHGETNKVRAAYNRAEFAAERRALLAAWAEFLATPQRAPRARSNVRELKRAGAAA